MLNIVNVHRQHGLNNKKTKHEEHDRKQTGDSSKENWKQYLYYSISATVSLGNRYHRNCLSIVVTNMKAHSIKTLDLMIEVISKEDHYINF